MTRFLTFLLTLLIGAIFFCASKAIGATFPAASCKDTDVQSAINLAIAGGTNGNIVSIPSGSSTWTNGISWSNVGITLTGAGTNQTVITDGLAGAANLITIIGISNNVLETVCNLTINSRSGGGNEIIAYQANWNTNALLHVYNIAITNLAQTAILPYGGCKGLLDHFYIECPVAGTGIYFFDGGNINDSNAWNGNFSWGTSNAFFMEDGTFKWDTTSANGAVDGLGGCSYVVRHCTILNGNVGNHGTDSGGSIRSCLAAEVYDNIFNFNQAGFAFSFRGGSALIWSNTLSSLNSSGNGATANTTVACYRADGTNDGYANPLPPPPFAVCCLPWGPITGTNKWDGNTDVFGYPGLDQIGRTGSSTYGATNTTQALNPCYSWGNTWTPFGGATTNASYFQTPNLTNLPPYDYISTPQKMIQEGRDVISNTQKPGYTPFVYPNPLQAGESGGSPASSPFYLYITNFVTITNIVTIYKTNIVTKRK